MKNETKVNCSSHLNDLGKKIQTIKKIYQNRKKIQKLGEEDGKFCPILSENQNLSDQFFSAQTTLLKLKKKFGIEPHLVSYDGIEFRNSSCKVGEMV